MVGWFNTGQRDVAAVVVVRPSSVRQTPLLLACRVICQVYFVHVLRPSTKGKVNQFLPRKINSTRGIFVLGSVADSRHAFH